MFIHALTALLLTFGTNFPHQAVDPEIPVYTFDQFEPYLNKKTDTTYVINFWATWCKPCVEELPYFESLLEQYKGKKVKVILVSLDFAEKLEKTVKPFVEKKGLKSDIMILDDPDANAWINKVDPSWSGAIPATVIYKKNKRSFHEGKFTETELMEAFKKIYSHD